MQRIILLSDIHFGIKNNNREWFDIQMNYFNNFLLPKIAADDILFILGDIFDNRSSLNLYVIHQIVTNLFNKLSKSFKEIHILIGNHDMYFKDNNNVTSIDLLKYPNIFIYKDPTTITLENQKFLFIPYYEDKVREQEILQKNRNSNTICLMHADISGFFYNKNIMVDANAGNDISCYAGYKHIYTGHFHLRQKNKNITYIGSPYHMDRNDVGNERGLYRLTVNNGEFNEEFILNDYSPKFIKLNVADLDKDNIESVMNNNFVDIIVNDSKIENTDLHNKLKQYKTAKDIKVQIIEKDADMNIVYTDTTKFDLLQLFTDFIKQKHHIEEKESIEYVDYVNELYTKLKN